MKVFVSQSCLTLCNTMDFVARQAPLSLGFSRKEYWSGLPFPSPDDLLYPGIELMSLMSPALSGGFFTTSTTWEAPIPSTKVKEIKAKINKWDQIKLINFCRTK